MQENLITITRLLDFGAPSIESLIEARGWQDLPEDERIGAAYDFVRNEIAFGYNRDDAIPASEVLQDGRGQCNTKGVLLMALLRALRIPCRIHGFTIHKGLQRGVMPELAFALAPPEILHSWVEVFHDGRWITLEGFILDAPYLSAVQRAFGAGPLCAYGVGTNDLTNPGVTWCGRDTFIQSTGIARDLGLFDDPDALFGQHAQALGPVRGWIYRNIARHWMNRRTERIRTGRFFAEPAPRSSEEGEDHAA